MFTHLHVFSSYSFLRGLASPQSLVRSAVQAGMSSLALTDFHSLTGAVEFYDACQAAGIAPILGAELSLSASGLQEVGPASIFDLPASQEMFWDPKDQRFGGRASFQGRVVLLAESLQGWANLCRLCSQESELSLQEITTGQLAAHSDGLICLTGGRQGLAAELLRRAGPQAAKPFLAWLAEVFPGRVYAELQIHAGQDRAWVDALAVLAAQAHIPVVATHTIAYLQPQDHYLQKVLTAIRLNLPLMKVPETALAAPQACFQSQAEMEARFASFPEALEASAEVASRCWLELPLGKPVFPHLELPDGLSAQQILAQRAAAGAVQRYGQMDATIQSRLEKELRVIEGLGYAPLFLIVEEILSFARRNGVPISSRGSAASSLVAFSLGITAPDPVRLDLYFERFLNPVRAKPPDIDTDLCSRRRDRVIQHVYQQYGADRVAMVCTINRFRRRSALRETAKAHGLTRAQVNKLVESLPYHGWDHHHHPVEAPPYEELAGQYPSPQHQAIFQDAAAILGLPRHLSVHPGGIVISPQPLNDLAPTVWAAKGVRITQFDLDAIERIGLVKIDLLGIRGLSVLGDVCAEVAPQQGLQDSPLEFLDRIPQQDEPTSARIETAQTIGCFQIESPGMRATLREIHARTLDDLMVALALFRPGPLTGGLKNSFVNSYRQRHLPDPPAAQIHPALSPLLADTYGVILYQEQVLKVAHELAGLSLADADLLRRAMSHFNPGKQMETLKEKFILGAWNHRGVPQVEAERIWEMMLAFAGYGFPKAHAASYAIVAWRAAWCKTHLPAVFMTAVLSNWGGFYSQRAYLTEARRMGLNVSPPHVNYSEAEFSVKYLAEKPVLFMGLNQIRELTRRAQARILRGRPFHSLEDFLGRVDPRVQEAEHLIKVGALAGFGPVPTLLSNLASGRRAKGQLSLFPLDLQEGERDSGAMPSGADWSLPEKVAAEEALLGAPVSAHPLELLTPEIASAQAVTTLEAAARPGQSLRVAGVRQSWTRSRTLRGEMIYTMTIEDLEGNLEIRISGEVYRRDRAALAGAEPVILEGRVETDFNTGEPYLQAARIWRIR